jgi:A/G-specific adenine glycosylase
MVFFSKQLLFWYSQNKRDLPWRETNDPYLIWISEIILQQTRVVQGLEYYKRFVAKWPDVQSLTAAPEQEVMKMWQGLGYYSRARNLLAAARTIVSEYNSRFPDTASGLKKLKGIGDYTAAAIASIAFDEKIGVVDGNVIRFITRVFGIDEASDSPVCRQIVQQKANELMGDNHPGTFNQALMEFGALMCTPSNPDCQFCPLNSICEAYRQNAVALFPVKKQKVKVRDRYFSYLVFIVNMENEKFTFISKRSENDIWKSLFEFPLIESNYIMNANDLFEYEVFRKLTGEHQFRLISVSPEIRHQLTHQRLHARFFVFQLEKAFNSQPEFLSLVNLKELGEYPLPRLIDRFLQLNDLSIIDLTD